MAHHNDLIGHNTTPDRNKPNPSPNRPHAAEPTRKALVTRESGDGSAHCVRGDSIRTHIWRRDFPHLRPNFDNGRFTAIVTNPPFGQNLKISATDCRLAGLEIAKRGGDKYKALEIELLFLERSYQLLKMEGA